MKKNVATQGKQTQVYHSKAAHYLFTQNGPSPSTCTAGTHAPRSRRQSGSGSRTADTHTKRGRPVRPLPPPGRGQPHSSVKPTRRLVSCVPNNHTLMRYRQHQLTAEKRRTSQSRQTRLAAVPSPRERRPQASLNPMHTRRRRVGACVGGREKEVARPHHHQQPHQSQNTRRGRPLTRERGNERWSLYRARQPQAQGYQHRFQLHAARLQIEHRRLQRP